MTRVALVLVVLLGWQLTPAFAQLQVREKSSVKRPYGTFAISPDGKLAVSGGTVGNPLVVTDVATGKEVARIESYTRDNTPPPYVRVAFSANGNMLAAGNNLRRGDGVVVLLDVKARKQVGVLRQPDWVGSLAFHPDGKTLAIGTNGGVSLWEVPIGRERAILGVGAIGTVASLKYSPDGKLLYIGQFNHDTGTSPEVWDTETEKKVWDTGTETKQEVPELQAARDTIGKPNDPGYQRPLLLSPDTTVLVTLAKGTSGQWALKLWDLKAKKERATVELDQKLSPKGVDPRSLSFSPDGKLLVIQLGGIKLIAVETGKHLAAIEGVRPPLVFSKDGKTLTGFWEGPKQESAIKAWELIWEKEPGK